MSGSLLIKSSSDADTSAINVLVGAELYHVFACKREQGLDEVCLIAGNGYRIIVGILYFVAYDVGVGTIVERDAILNAYGARNRTRGHSMMIIRIFIILWFRIVSC